MRRPWPTGGCRPPPPPRKKNQLSASQGRLCTVEFYYSSYIFRPINSVHVFNSQNGLRMNTAGVSYTPISGWSWNHSEICRCEHYRDKGSFISGLALLLNRHAAGSLVTTLTLCVISYPVIRFVEFFAVTLKAEFCWLRQEQNQGRDTETSCKREVDGFAFKYLGAIQSNVQCIYRLDELSFPKVHCLSAWARH
jgi:hypothetical protein